MFKVDISNVKGNIRNFPNAPVEATVQSARLDVSQKGSPMVVIELECYHPQYGSATVRDYLPSTFPDKIKAFWMAINDFNEEDLAGQTDVEFDPNDLAGSSLIVQIGDREDTNTGKVYKQIVSPWYYPISRVDLLQDQPGPF